LDPELNLTFVVELSKKFTERGLSYGKQKSSTLAKHIRATWRQSDGSGRIAVCGWPVVSSAPKYIRRISK
jgi:hypothetical protein